MDARPLPDEGEDFSGVDFGKQDAVGKKATLGFDLDRDPFGEEDFASADVRIHDVFSGPRGPGFHGPGPADKASMFFSDPYGHEDDTLRGVAIPSAIPMLSTPFEQSSDFPAFLQQKQPPAKVHNWTASPPPAQFLGPSTIHVAKNCSAAQLADALVEHHESLPAEFAIKPDKFSVKATIFQDHVGVKVKTRVYDAGEQGWAVEFSRYQGDALKFNQIYQGFECMLRKRNLLVDDSGGMQTSFSAFGQFDDFPDLLDDDPMEEDTAEDDLEPILNLGGSDSKELRAEAASTLAQLTSKADSSHAACVSRSGKALGVIRKFFDNSELEIVYPASCILWNLARHKESAERLLDHGVLAELLGLLGSEWPTLVKRRVAEVVKFLCTSGSPKNSNATIQSLQQLLNKVDDKCRNELREAIERLQ